MSQRAILLRIIPGKKTLCSVSKLSSFSGENFCSLPQPRDFSSGPNRSSEIPPLSHDSLKIQNASVDEETLAILETPRGSLNRELALKAISIIQNQKRGKDHHTPKPEPDEALKLLERLLEEEALTGNIFYNSGKGFVLNVLKSCRHGLGNINRLRRVLGLLENNDRLWDEKVLASVAGTMTMSRMPNAPEKAHALLNSIQESAHAVVKPNIFAYTFVLSGYAKQGMANQAEQLLNRTHDLYDAKELKVGPSTVSYNCVMNAIARSNEPDAPERASKLLTRMKNSSVEPDLLTYNYLLKVYARNDMSKEAEKLLQSMYKLHDDGELKQLPDIFSYNSVMKALASSGRPDAPERAETLLTNMPIQPNELTYNSLLSCYSSASMSHEAEELLTQMRSLHKSGKLKNGPSSTSYSHVIKALTKRCERNAPDRAKKILHEMRELHGIQPTVFMYNCLLDCYSNSGLAKEAELLLQQMLDLHNSGDLEKGPTTESFGYVMDAWAKSGDPNSSKAARLLLDQMRELHASGYPDIHPDDVASKVGGTDNHEDNLL